MAIFLHADNAFLKQFLYRGQICLQYLDITSRGLHTFLKLIQYLV